MTLYLKLIIKYKKLSNIYPVPMYLHLDISKKCNDPDDNIDIMLVDITVQTKYITPYSGGIALNITEKFFYFNGNYFTWHFDNKFIFIDFENVECNVAYN